LEGRFDEQSIDWLEDTMRVFIEGDNRGESTKGDAFLEVTREFKDGEQIQELDENLMDEEGGLEIVYMGTSFTSFL
jgi:hypothetical protein